MPKKIDLQKAKEKLELKLQEIQSQLEARQTELKSKKDAVKKHVDDFLSQNELSFDEFVELYRFTDKPKDAVKKQQGALEAGKWYQDPENPSDTYNENSHFLAEKNARKPLWLKNFEGKFSDLIIEKPLNAPDSQKKKNSI